MYGTLLFLKKSTHNNELLGDVTMILLKNLFTNVTPIL